MTFWAASLTLKRFVLISLHNLPSTSRTGNHIFGFTSTVYARVVGKSLNCKSEASPLSNCVTKTKHQNQLCGKVYMNVFEHWIITCSMDHLPSNNWKSPSTILKSISRLLPCGRISSSFSKQSRTALALNLRPNAMLCCPICSKKHKPENETGLYKYHLMLIKETRSGYQYGKHKKKNSVQVGL